MIYAALDAFVLLEVFNALKFISTTEGKLEKFEEIAMDLIRTKNKAPKVEKMISFANLE